MSDTLLSLDGTAPIHTHLLVEAIPVAYAVLRLIPLALVVTFPPFGRIVLGIVPLAPSNVLPLVK